MKLYLDVCIAKKSNTVPTIEEGNVKLTVTSDETINELFNNKNSMKHLKAIC